MASLTPETGLYDNKGPQVLVIVILFPILAAIAVALRLYTRFRIISNPALDDLFAVIGLLFSIASSICMIYQVHYGMGRHIMTLTMAQGIGSLKALYASIINYNFSLLFIKLSILLQYLRICTSKKVQYACYAVMVYVVLYGLDCLFSGVFTCYPVARFWDKTIPGHCINENALWFANGGLNILGDFMILILPVFILEGLIFLKARQKIMLVLLLGLGGFACIASVIRLHALYVVTKSADITWVNPGTAIWSCLELNVALICSCLGTLKPFASRFFPNFFGLTKKSTGRYAYDQSHSLPRRGNQPAETAEDGGENGWKKIKSSNSFGDRGGSSSGELYPIQKVEEVVLSDDKTYRDERDDFSRL